LEDVHVHFLFVWAENIAIVLLYEMKAVFISKSGDKVYNYFPLSKYPSSNSVQNRKEQAQNLEKIFENLLIILLFWGIIRNRGSGCWILIKNWSFLLSFNEILQG
jgi:hypothetical protein